MAVKPEHITKKIHKLINQIIFMEKKNIFKTDGLSLYPSEIHLILVMSENPKNATQMAEALGITKGAVSQTITRLEKKSILKKEKDPLNKNELTLSFTPFGKKVFNKYQKLISDAFRKHETALSLYSENELDVIDRFVTHLEAMFSNLH